MSFFEIASKIFEGLQKDPKGFYLYGKALVKGSFYIAFYRLFRRNVRIKLPFLVFCKKVKICGPGSVFIDKGCSVFLNAFDGLTILTFSADAQVIIGKKCNLGGMTIRCHKSVVIGNYIMSANCLVQDTLFSAARPLSLKADEIDLVSPLDVYIGNKVWLAGQTIILGGSKIGDGSILSVGSICFNCDVAKNHLAIGNPVSGSVSIEKITNFFGIQ